jgi:hypothetical protein
MTSMNGVPAKILLVRDNPADMWRTQESLKESRIKNGEKRTRR